MKKATILVLILTMLFGYCFAANAHSGRTDKKGGHYDRKTGKYHYHKRK